MDIGVQPTDGTVGEVHSQRLGESENPQFSLLPTSLHTESERDMLCLDD
jgi:hypothetical protein